MRVAFVDTSPFWKYSYGPAHPFRLYRLMLTQKMQEMKRLLEGVKLLTPEPIDENKLLLFHTRDYLDILKMANTGEYRDYMAVYGLGYGDNPVFPGVYDYSRLVAGASSLAAKQVVEGKAERAFNMAGGLHHAMPDRAYGFCYLNDPVMAIYELLERYDRILYLDIDAHHGDGVQLAFYYDDRVLTVSTHESGRYLFPGTGYEYEMGEGKGYGYALNVPFPPGAGDDVYTYAFGEVVIPAIRRFNPQVIVSQLGADALSGDPLTHWNLTLNSYLEVLRFLDSLNLPWVALGGGGYNVANVVRAWTWVLAVLTRRETDTEVPPEWIPLGEKYGVRLKSLAPEDPTGSSSNVRVEVEGVVSYLKRRHPLLTGVI